MGGGLSCPVTTLHVERYNTPYFHSGCVHLQGWRTSQEDEHNMLRLKSGAELFAVYDGHGGYHASEYLKTQIPLEFDEITDFDDHEKLTELMLKIDRIFLSGIEAEINGKKGKIKYDDGSTCCIAITRLWDLENNAPLPRDRYPEVFSAEACRGKIGVKLLTINIGDSRIMIVRSNGEHIQCTEDHKPSNPEERARIIAAGGHVVNARIDSSLALSRAIGDQVYKSDSRLTQRTQKVIAVPEFQEHMIYYGDVLLVCCDGIYETEEMAPQNVGLIVHTQAEKYGNESYEKFLQHTKHLREKDVENKEEEKEKKNDEEQQSNTANETKTDETNDAATADEKGDVNEDDAKTTESKQEPAQEQEQTSKKDDDSSTLEKEVYEKQLKRYEVENKFDPAQLARDIILESLMMNSKDNHTAIVIQFRGYDKDEYVDQQLLNLPQKEVIPGPTVFSQEASFHTEYRRDLLSGTDFSPDLQTLIDSINIITKSNPPIEKSVLISAFGQETGRAYEDVVNTCRPAMEAYKCDLSQFSDIKTPSINPIVVSLIHQTPELTQNLMNFYYKSQYSQDDDDSLM